MKTNHFEYPTPYLSELKEMYVTPYRFSDELRAYVDYMFTHPYNKYNSLYDSLRLDRDSNDMAKSAYLIARYFIDHPNQFAGKMDNVVPAMIVSMWKAFLNLHKQCRGAVFTQYYPAQMRLLMMGKGKFLDLLLEEIKDEKMIMSGDDMVKRREGKGLREQGRASLREGGSHFEYLCSLE